MYNALFRGEARECGEDEPPDEVECCSHLRRKFWEAATVSNKPVAEEARLRTQKIFQLEAFWEKLAPSKQKEKRQRLVKPLIQVLFKWLHVQHEEIGQLRGLLSSRTGYATRHESAFLRFLEDGRLEMTNNHSERALRPIAVGRKNFLFVGTETSGKNIAGLYSLIATCDAHGVNPLEYLANVVRRVSTHPASRIDELLPDHWKPAT